MRTSLGTRCAQMYWRYRCQVSVWLAVRDRFACWWSVALRARVLNQTMPQVAAKLGATVTIWHQSGKAASKPCSRPMPPPDSRSIK